MIILGLTGSIGMGKSTVADMFKYLGHPTQDADKVVHDLMGPSGKAIDALKENFPDVVTSEGVDRQKLGGLVFNNPEQLKILESIIHPLVDQERKRFLAHAERMKAQIAVLDIPLLFEKKLDQKCDFTVVARAPDFIQKQRVLKRQGMTIEKLNAIKKQQMPMAEKLLQADFVVQTGLGKGHSMREVKDISNLLCDADALDKWKLSRPRHKSAYKRSR